MKFLDTLKVHVSALAIAAFACSPLHAQGFNIPDGSSIQGHVKTVPQAGAVPPTAVGCTIAAGATDFAGTCTASAASGSITFARTYGTAPACVVWDQSATSTVSMPVYTVSATAITLTTIINAHVLGYICMGQASSS